MTSQSTASEELSGCALEGMRSHTYRLLGALLRCAPSAELLSTLAKAHVDRDQGPVASAWADLASAAAELDTGAVDDEYHALFIGLGRGELLPYGSYYLSGSLMGRPLAALRRDLAALGFERHEDVREPEDHAAAMLDVMAVLSDPGSGDSVQLQRDFFESHLAGWLGAFFDDLQQARNARFYRPVGVLGGAFFDLECGYLDVAARAPRSRSETGEVS